MNVCYFTYYSLGKPIVHGVLLSPYRKRCPLQSPERINNKERR